MRKLTVDEILDLRAYERVRAEMRHRIMEMKRRRRFALGDLVTIVFENVDTMRYQVQEMARTEKMLRDEQIEQEVAVYNELVPDDGELCGTLFVELTSDALLREWLPKLVGIQRAVSIHVGPEGDELVVPPSPLDEDRLTHEEITASVHYLDFRVGAERAAEVAERIRRGPVRIVVDHPNYHAEAVLDDDARAELAGDLEPSPAAV